ncbi:HXXEE domain-containing protein [Numidum massiliense]|uniref:HXXEE domain-containing protein n=1 Tax=Numidum massiliense TaxID=1522315 RepID=UPI0006D596F4|nr:HXXEE domain-containing protein [Numidum massiliense]
MLLNWLNAHLDLLSVVWLFPVVFMFHDFEEILTAEKWTKRNQTYVLEKISPRMRKFLSSSFQMTTLQFATDVFWVFCGVTLATVLAAVFSAYYLFLPFVVFFGLHAFTHLGQALYLRRYTPGVVTSVLIVFPYALYTVYRLWSGQTISVANLVWSILSLCLIVPLLFFLLVRGRDKIRKKSMNE